MFDPAAGCAAGPSTPAPVAPPAIASGCSNHKSKEACKSPNCEWGDDNACYAVDDPVPTDPCAHVGKQSCEAGGKCSWADGECSELVGTTTGSMRVVDGGQSRRRGNHDSFDKLFVKQVITI